MVTCSRFKWFVTKYSDVNKGYNEELQIFTDCSLKQSCLNIDKWYRSGTVNSNTVNSKFHLIRIIYEISVNIFSIISCSKCTVNSNFYLIQSKTLPANDFELTVSNLYCDVTSFWHYDVIIPNAKFLPITTLLHKSNYHNSVQVICPNFIPLQITE